MQIPQLPADKAAHFIAGAVIFAAIGAVTNVTGFPEHARLIGAAAALAAGVAKELSDKRQNERAVAAGQSLRHGVEGADVAATLGGALFCWLAAIVTT